MDAQQIFTLGQQGLNLILVVGAPVLITVLIVGVVVSIIQAATQINESTLSFLPKLIAAAIALFIAGPWMVSLLVDYLKDILLSIPKAVG